MAADSPEGESTTVGTNITLSLSGDDADVLAGYFEKLSEDGTVTVPLEKQMWGDSFGMLTDKFGVQWMVNIAGEGSASG
jgi:PhnB protein